MFEVPSDDRGKHLCLRDSCTHDAETSDRNDAARERIGSRAQELYILRPHSIVSRLDLFHYGINNKPRDVRLHVEVKSMGAVLSSL